MKQGAESAITKAATHNPDGTSPWSKKVDARKRPDARETEPGISDIINALPFYVMLVDEEHYILQANSAVEQELGVEPESIIGEYCPQIIHGLDQPIDRCPLEESVQTNQTVEREIFDEPSGRWVQSCIYPTRIKTESGKRIYLHMITDITDRKDAEEKLQVTQEHLRDLSFHLESVREEERKDSAREIHDELGQLLTSLKMDLAWLSRRIPGSEAALIGKAKEMDRLVDGALESVKKVSGRLRPAVLDHIGISAAIEWQMNELGKHSEIDFKFRPVPKNITLDPERSTAIFRICQEALTNVIRHSSASNARITLKKESSRIVLTVNDNGKGIDEQQISDRKALGLIGMRERARHWNGEVQIKGTPGKGTRISVSIPLTYHGAS